MLVLHFGDLPEALLSGDEWFNFRTNKSCVTTDFGKRVIAGIDKAEVYDEYLIRKDGHGFPPERLAGGTKSLLILMFEDMVVDLAAMGDNCFPYLKEIADVKDIRMCTDHVRLLFKHGGFKELKIENSGFIAHSDMDMFHEWARLSFNGELG